MESFGLLVITAVLRLFLETCLVVDVTSYPSVVFVSVHVGDNPTYGYHLARPVYEVAIQEIQQRFPKSLGNISYTYVYLPGFDLCPDGGDRVAQLVTEFYFSHPEIFDAQDVYPVLASPECSAQALQLADLGREMDLPVFTSNGGDARLTNKIRYPTTAATASLAGPDVNQAVLALLERFSWSTVGLICDNLSGHLGLSNFFLAQCTDARRNFANHSMTWYYLPIDSTIPLNYADVLEPLQSMCRIFVILTMPVYLRETMIAAHSLGMTSGDYVFITLQPTNRPGIEDVTWFSGNVTSDEVVFEAYKTLIVLTGVNPNRTEIAPLTDKFAAKAMEMFNDTTLGKEDNEPITSVYESTLMFAQIFDESYPDVFSLPKTEIIKMAFSRTFHFAGRNFTTDRNGGLITLIKVYRLNPISKAMEDAMTYNGPLQQFLNVAPDLWYWVNRTGPPPDRPVCGFQNNECTTSTIAKLITGGSAAAASVVVLILIGTGLTWYCRHRLEIKELHWLLQSPPSQAITTPAALLDSMLVESVVGARLAHPKGHMYALKIVSSTSLTAMGSNKKFLETVLQLQRIHHPNVTVFHGVAALENFIPALMSEYGEKRTLYQLIRDSANAQDKKLQYLLVWDLLDGAEYLHHTGIHHGDLSSIVCILDARMTLKISQLHYTKLLDVLQAEPFPPLLDVPISLIRLIWKPPEVLKIRGDPHKAVKLAGTKDCDVYAFGMIVFEVFARTLPYDASLHSKESAEVSVEKLLYETGYANDLADRKAQFDPQLLSIVASCSAPAGHRPTLKLIKSQLRKIQARPTGYVGHILRQLEKHAVELEDTIAVRTRELEYQREKADILLQEMLPAHVVRMLRNKQPVPCEAFTSATILFSDLPVFGKVALLCPPLDIIKFLNTLYSVFDAAIQDFDVYKVETVNDSYVMVSGLPRRNDDRHAWCICSLAATLCKLSRTIMDPTDRSHPVQLRAGVNTGLVVAGVIGQKMPRYCLFGDTMNTASRMESHGEGNIGSEQLIRTAASAALTVLVRLRGAFGGKIHISGSTKALVETEPGFLLISRGIIAIKGKGAMETFWLDEKPDESMDL